VGWCASSGLIWTRYDDADDWAVYDQASADIHLLTDSAHRLWMLVSTGPASSSDQLAASLAVEIGRPLDDQLLTGTREALLSLSEAGLIQPAGL